ncbi:MAG TPA: glycosyltransferase family 2 protein [Mobilitalea sp.]|nr:glycosyltransferase family 2 protein [Mobilitalea sp.]
MCSVSIILPFYNAIKYLERCIDSILRQTYADFELLLINDGSSDGGGTIGDSFSSRDARVKVIHLERNMGVSNARNTGIASACGEYITFIDSDDWVDDRYLELMLQKMEETDADLICCSHVNKNEQGVDIFYTSEIAVEISNRIAIIGLFQNRYVQPVVWGKLFKKAIIVKHGLEFDRDICMSEDIKFVYEYLSFCTTCYLIETPLYWYVNDNPESAMNSNKVNAVFKEKWLSAWTSYVRMGQHTEKYFPDDKEIKRVFLCSQTSAARMKLHLILEFCYRNKCIYKELLSFLRQHILLFLKYDYSKLPRKIMIGICAISPRLEFTLWKLIK